MTGEGTIDKIKLNLYIGLSYDINEFAKKTMTNIDAKMPTFSLVICI